MTAPLVSDEIAAVAPDALPATTSSNVISKSLTQEQLDAIVAKAIERWVATGLAPGQISVLNGLRFEIADLSGLRLGEATDIHIRVDRKAGGAGWLLAPEDESVQIPDQLSNAGIDLLTAIMHEMGHALGLSDSYLEQDRDSLMYGYLTKGERRFRPKIRPGARPRTPAKRCIS